MDRVPIEGRDRFFAISIHFAPLVGAILPTGHILLPLALLLFGPKSEFVRAHAKESLNAQIAYTAYLLLIILLGLTVVGLVVAIPFAFAVLFIALWNMVLVVFAPLGQSTVVFAPLGQSTGAIQAGRGEGYAYRMIFRLVP